MSPRISQVDQAILADVRSIGKVLGEDIVEGFAYGGGVEITNELIIDVGGVDSQDSLNRASDLLAKRDWVILSQRPNRWVMLKSTTWEGAHININALDSLSAKEFSDKLRKVIVGANDRDSILIVNVYQT
ncbi:hypothetical protein GCM10010140_10930 [Streptosporangium pseudovulgare]|uniref:Uncharacterized protein n=1 Tax=Streptosporangium pseudovulgare TaxID=35765 RepID=A0ABQ2QJR3_9ACTN|nr:hypothetical protein GCM10010140_10930 [Streptosporangium pseudovulgare]